MIATFIDVEDPIRNVYCDKVPTAPVPGAVWDFGFARDSSMSGAWRILSVERPYRMDGLVSDGIRVNVIRAERLRNE